MAIPSGYTALDFVGFTDKGAYANNVTYVKNDLVHYGGDIWKCKIDNTIGIIPAVGANWEQWLRASANLVERIIAPLEQNPATVAYATGRQIIYDDWLWEVIAPIAIGDTLVDYAVDPSNANIKKAPAVETQLLALSSKAYQTDDATETSIADDDLLPFYDTSATAKKKSTWSNIIAKIKAKLGTAATKNVPTSGNASSTQVVMGNDTRLTDARNAADVSAWAKAANKPSYTASEISYGTGSNVGSEIQTLTNQVTTFEGNIAPVENGTNYSKTYVIGDEFIRNNLLYKVTVASVGTTDAITVGANCTRAETVTYKDEFLSTDWAIPIRVNRAGRVCCLCSRYANITTALTANTEYIIGTLPQEFRPKQAQYLGIVAVAANGNFVCYAFLMVGANGRVSITPNTSVPSGMTIFFSVTYETA